MSGEVDVATVPLSPPTPAATDLTSSDEPALSTISMPGFYRASQRQDGQSLITSSAQTSTSARIRAHRGD